MYDYYKKRGHLIYKCRKCPQNQLIAFHASSTSHVNEGNKTLSSEMVWQILQISLASVFSAMGSQVNLDLTHGMWILVVVIK